MNRFFGAIEDRILARKRLKAAEFVTQEEYDRDVQGRFERLRQQAIPFAEARGYRTDEDIFKDVS